MTLQPAGSFSSSRIALQSRAAGGTDTLSNGNLSIPDSPVSNSPMYLGGLPRGQEESPRCFIQAPISADLNSVHVLQNDRLTLTHAGTIPGSTMMTRRRSSITSCNGPNTRSRSLRVILNPKHPFPFVQPVRQKLRGTIGTCRTFVMILATDVSPAPVATHCRCECRQAPCTVMLGSRFKKIRIGHQPPPTHPVPRCRRGPW